MLQLLIFASALIASLGLTMAVRRYVLSRAILDHPNHRSMHTVPVARGGGLAIACVTIAGVALLAVLHRIDARVALALAGGGVLVAVIGWLDDARGGISAGLRAGIQFAVALWALFWLGGLPTLSLGTITLELGAFGSVLAAIGIVWWINLYNFMDGIDGIAGGQAVTAAGFGALLLLLLSDASTATIAALTAGAAAGFLIMNWTPARIFMGDAGSGFLGYVFAVLAIASERAGSLPLVVWLILSGVFIFDSTVTLWRRFIRGEKVWSAHRSHAYQRLTASGFSHAAVSGGVMAFNAVLAGLALVAALLPAATPYMILLAVLFLAGAYFAIEKRTPMQPRRKGELLRTRAS